MPRVSKTLKANSPAPATEPTTTMADNIDPSLLKGMDEQTMEIVNQTQKKGKKEIVKRERCCAAVRFTTIKEAYEAVANVPVFIVKNLVNGDIKESSYSRCSKTVTQNKETGNYVDFCHTHWKKHQNHDTLYVYDEIVQQANDENSDWREAKEEDAYFSKMEKDRGSRPRIQKRQYKFATDNDPIYQILIHKNGKLRTRLLRSAQEILRDHMQMNGKKVHEESENDEESSVEETPKAIKRGRKTSTEKKASPPPRATQTVDSSEDETESVEDSSEDEAEEVVTQQVVEEVSLEPDFGSDDEEEDDGEKYEKLTSMNGYKLFYFPQSKMIYRLTDEKSGESEPVGKMYSISQQNATIQYKGDFYTTFSKITYKEDGNKYLHSELDDKVYDFKKRLVGNLVKKGRTFKIQPIA